MAISAADDQEAEVVVGAGSAFLALVALWGRVEREDGLCAGRGLLF